MNLVELAQRIKNLRLAKRLTLEQVASQTGLTRSLLSKVENFRSTPSLTALGQIAAALGVPIGQLMEGLDEKPEIVIIRKGERKLVDRDGDRSRIVYESLAYKRTERTMDPFVLTISAEDTSREPLGHEGEEFMIVLSGQVNLRFGKETYNFDVGDCTYFDGTVPHAFINPYSIPTQILCVFYARQMGGETKA